MSIKMPANPGTPEAIFNALTGELEVDVAGNSNITLSDLQGQYGYLIFSGVLTGNIDVIVPAEDFGRHIYNATTGSFTLTVKASGTTGVAVTQGDKVILRYSTYDADVVAITAEL